MNSATQSGFVLLRQLSILLLLALIVGCASREEKDKALKDALAPAKEKYAPDDRVAVFDVAWEWASGGLVAKGDVGSETAKAEALEILRTTSGTTVFDSLKVLPDTSLGEKKYGIVIVSVGNVRGNPRQSAELVTQALMGTVVKLMKSRGGYFYIQLPDDYLGWLEDDAMRLATEEEVQAWQSAGKVIATGHFGIVRERPDEAALPLSDAVAGDLMKELGTSGRWTRVELPDTRKGFVESKFVQNYNTWKRTRRLTPENIEKTAKMFLGVPYLWGGTSAKGMDCSGYSKTVFRLNGLELQRDADQQATLGEEVPLDENFTSFKKGDLLFFGRKASDTRPERITHVGIYLQNREFIHTPGGSYVKTNSFDPKAENYSESLLKSFVRGRRVIGTVQIPEVMK